MALFFKKIVRSNHSFYWLILWGRNKTKIFQLFPSNFSFFSFNLGFGGFKLLRKKLLGGMKMDEVKTEGVGGVGGNWAFLLFLILILLILGIGFIFV
jgi:hypothetical protein